MTTYNVVFGIVLIAWCALWGIGLWRAQKDARPVAREGLRSFWKGTAILAFSWAVGSQDLGAYRSATLAGIWLIWMAIDWPNLRVFLRHLFIPRAE